MKTLSLKKRGFTLIELLVVIGILAILLAITLIAINPARQFAQANNTKRASDVNAILNAIGQYTADTENAGVPPAEITTTDQEVAWDGTNGADLCSVLVPTYIQALPSDPETNNGDPVVWVDTDSDTVPDACPASYSTGYYVVRDANGRVTVSAPDAALGATIEVTR